MKDSIPSSHGITDFEHLGIPGKLVESLKRMQITVPTPIQSATIPIALLGSDILASAQTGTGKTVAYAIPLIIKLTASQHSTALILTPTRELAMQVNQTLNQILGNDSSFRTTLLIGGAPMGKQFAELKRRPQLIVGTPGRITDHLQRGSLVLDKTNFLIIDEADRMLDMGFGIQLDKIAEYLPEVRQTLMFSATVPSNIEKLSKKYLRDPQRISVGSSVLPAPKIKQEIIHTKGSEKFGELLKQLDQREGSIIVFVKTKRGAERLAKELKLKGHSSDAIHGDLQQRRRERVIHTFRAQKSRILVATDVAARGLDIPHVMHVINFELPQCPEDYIHRIGRTGRAGAEGSALCLVTPDEGHKWKAIARLMNPHGKESEPRSQQPKQSQRSRDFSPRSRFSKQSQESRDFKPRSRFSKDGQEVGDFAPRPRFAKQGQESRDFKPRSRSFKQDREGGDFAPRSSSFKQNREGGDAAPRARSFKQNREGGDFAPRSSSFKQNREGGDFAPRSSSFKQNREGGDFAPRFAAANQDQPRSGPQSIKASHTRFKQKKPFFGQSKRPDAGKRKSFKKFDRD